MALPTHPERTLLDDPDALLKALPEGSIGYVGYDLPEDVLAATGRMTAHLPFRPDAPTPFADAWLESSFPPAAASVLEDWSKGAFDHLEAVVFTRGDDGFQRLWYYIRELQRRDKIGGPRALIFDAVHAPKQTSTDYAASAIARLCDDLSIDTAMLRKGIAVANERRAIFSDLVRREDIDGLDKDLAARASLLPAFECWGADIEFGPLQPGNVKIVLAGSTPADGRIHAAVKAGGGDVVASLSDVSLNRLGPPVDEDAEDLFAAVGGASHANLTGPRSFADYAQSVLSAVQAQGAQAVILWVIEEDEARAWHVPRLRRALEQAGVPHLALTRRSWRFDDGATEEIKTFLEGLT